MTFAAKFRVKSLGQKKFVCLSFSTKALSQTSCANFHSYQQVKLGPSLHVFAKFWDFQVFKPGPIWWVWNHIPLCFYLLLSDYKQGWASSRSSSAIQGFQVHVLIHVLGTITFFFFLTNMKVWFLYSGLYSLWWFKRIANMKSFDGHIS